MALNTTEKLKIEKIVGGFCQTRVPLHVRNQVQLKYMIHDNNVIIIESRPFWKNRDHWIDTPIAKLKHDPVSLTWSLFWHRSNGQWISYPDFKPTDDLKKLIAEIDRDPIHVFWG